VGINKIFAMSSVVLGIAISAVLAMAGLAVADTAVSIRPAAGGGTALPEADADFARVLVRTAPDGGRPRWTRVDRAESSASSGSSASSASSGRAVRSVSFVYGATRRCLDLSDPDDGGSAVVVRTCAADSLSQRWERRGPALVDRDTGECMTQVTRGGEAILAAADCVPGDPSQKWLVGA
jgi:hypothetical protein